MSIHVWSGGPPFTCIQCAKRLPYNQIQDADLVEDCPNPLATSDLGQPPVPVADPGSANPGVVDVSNFDQVARA